MEYIQIGQQGEPIAYPVLEENLRYVFPGIEITPETMAPHGYRPILENKPNIQANQVVRRLGFSKQGDNFVWNWQVDTLDKDYFLNMRIRIRRDAELRDTDWTQTLDAPLTAEKKQQWAEYRQQLRDMTSAYPNINETTEITWPQRPQ